MLRIDRQKVVKLIRALDSSKAHGCDNIAIAMIKICDIAIVEPLCMIFEKCLTTGQYPSIWKKANIIPVHKKGSRQCKNNYRPISLLPVFGKLFKKLLYKLECNRIAGKLLHLIQNFLSNRKQRVLLNGKNSEWKDISAGVPQGSILGPLLFLVYMNDLVGNVRCDIKLFADDTSLFSAVCSESKIAEELDADLERVRLWAW